ncbi:MAG: MarR family transcriptional regulator [Bacteroidia bacterium]|nr:MarR family transcriptional regulator [Bacteroidia bacterium]MDW8235228.1 MarR family transcriptional regulator [Bacteroidia bacterium]
MYQEKRIVLTPAQQRLIEVWGRLAYAWGIGPAMAQIFALLYVYPEPLDADTLIEQLGISRGSASINLRKLLEWGLIQKIDLPNTRRSLYTATKDIWLIAARIIQKRFEREIVPVKELLQTLIKREDVQKDAHTYHVIRQMEEIVGILMAAVEVALPVLATQDKERIQRIIQSWSRILKRDGNRLSGLAAGGDSEAGGDPVPS